jgi:hypothetical protein
MDLETRAHIARYVGGKTDASELEDELEGIAWEDDSGGVSFVLRLLHELAHGDWTDEELRERLDPFARTYNVSSLPPVPNRTGTTAETKRQDRRLATVETLRVAVSA